MEKKWIKINPKDNVIIALDNLKAGYRTDDQKIILKSDINFGHKIATEDIAEGRKIVKYGNVIGTASQDIKAGEHVHSQNLHTDLNENLSYTYEPEIKTISEQYISKESSKEFKGYERFNGEVGIRNELWIIPTVGCINGLAEQIKKLFLEKNSYADFDGIEVLSHPYGCSQLGDDHEHTKNALCAAIKHPNAGGVLVLGLGCENNQIEQLKEALGMYNTKRVRFLVAQDTEDEIEDGLSLLTELFELIKTDKRTPQPISKLKIGLKCGGSDAFSGITANPLLGMFSDWFISFGGSTVLTEVPEMFGAEHSLMKRAKDEKTFNRIVELINTFKDYFRKNDQVIYENPSPGNKEGGITTLEEKSLGAIQKAGSQPVVDVLNYADQIKTNGLNLLWGPGNDLVSSSALAMSGCQMVLFTTGRGTPFGSFVPTMKVASNSKLFKRKSNWMDFNAGKLMETDKKDVLQSFIDFVISVANGKRLTHEKSGNKEIAIFKSGVTL